MTDHASPRRAGVIAVHSLNRFVFSVPDLAQAQAFYSAFGLDARRVGERVDLYTFGHPHCWASISANAVPKRLQYVSYGIYKDDLPAFRERTLSRRIGCAPHPLSDGTGLWLRDPDGTPLQLVVAPKVSPSAKTELRPRQHTPPGHDQGWGLGRHVPGSNYFHYVRDPWGSFAEYSHDIDFVPHDIDWPDTDHPPHDSFYVWGAGGAARLRHQPRTAGNGQLRRLETNR